MVRCQLSTNASNAAAAGLLGDLRTFRCWESKAAFVGAARETLLLAAPAAGALFELCMLAVLDQTDEEALRDYRLALKARLLRDDEQLLELEVAARKEELAERYEECFERYSAVLGMRRVAAALASALLRPAPASSSSSPSPS
eukprot:COSAG06_NODE_27579_length_590_cov_1.164969_1_plen_142_part_01